MTQDKGIKVVLIEQEAPNNLAVFRKTMKKFRSMRKKESTLKKDRKGIKVQNLIFSSADSFGARTV